MNESIKNWKTLSAVAAVVLGGIVLTALLYSGSEATTAKREKRVQPARRAEPGKPASELQYIDYRDEEEEEKLPVLPGAKNIASPECVACSKGHDDCAPLVDACSKVEGVAAAGPAAGTSRKVLCEETLECISRTGCGTRDPAHCYCGVDGDLIACMEGSYIDGPCKKEIERSLESTDNKKILATYLHQDLGGGMALARTTCAHANCREVCF